MEISDLIKANILAVDLQGTDPAISISGGIDSTIVLYHVIRDLMGGTGRKVNTYTIVFGDETFERDKARKVSQLFGTNHTEVRIEKSDFLTALPEILKEFPFPRYNVWQHFIVSRAAEIGTKHFFIGEGANELFGYADRTFLEGWAGQLTWITPSWRTACKRHGMVLHAPFLEIQSSTFFPLLHWYKPPDKEYLKASYRKILPDFVVEQKSNPPAPAFYKMLDMSHEELQWHTARAWAESRNEKYGSKECTGMDARV